jgi:L-alanine-DL-glutamate epimerase-like enolase superfamily enzyme
VARAQVKVDSVEVRIYRVPTEGGPEQDGTLEWDSTTAVVVLARGGERQGLGYSYASEAAGRLVSEKLIDVVVGGDALDVAAAYRAMIHALRNVGRPGAGTMAVSAVDVALWDLKARLLGVPLVKALGMVREGIPAYGSGGFTNYADDRLQAQLRRWAEQGMRSVKIKVGAHADQDLARARAARDAIGPRPELFVDANGAYEAKQALRLADGFAELGVTWFEEPVSSDDLDGLHLLRRRMPPGVRVAAGEYGDTPFYFRRMLAANAVDVLQADATRCGGITGFLHAAAIAHAFEVPLSAHTAPALHATAASAAIGAINLEYFHDHARLEPMLFDGVPRPEGGLLAPRLDCEGLGLELRGRDAERYRV